MNSLKKSLEKRTQLKPPELISHPHAICIPERRLNNTCANKRMDSRFRNLIQCWNCKEFGHAAQKCPKPNQGWKRPSDPSLGRSGSTPGAANVVRGTSKCRYEREDNACEIYIERAILGKKLKCLPDSGADLTLTPVSFGEDYHVSHYRDRLQAANGRPIIVLGAVTVGARYGKNPYLNRFKLDGLVSGRVTDVMLGNAFLRKHNAIWECFHTTIF